MIPFPDFVDDILIQHLIVGSSRWIGMRSRYPHSYGTAIVAAASDQLRFDQPLPALLALPMEFLQRHRPSRTG
jgi:hypothetical protein